MFRSGCCTKHGVNVAVGISIPESDVRITCIHIFFLVLQALNSDVATIICQCCDGPSDEKIMIGCPSGSSTAFDMES